MLYKRLFRVSLVAIGAALALAGCEGATPVDRAEPDTVPEFSGSITNQTYKALQDIDALTLPRATGGNGDLSYSLGPTLPDGLSFDAGTRTLSGMPFQTAHERVVYRMSYRVDDDDDNSSSRDADTIDFTITIQPHTILENVVSAVAVGAGAGRLVYDSVPDPSGGPAISISGSGTIVTGGSFFLDVVAEAGAPIDTLLVSVEKEAAGYYEMELPGNASSYRLVGAVPYDLDQTRAASSVGLCVTAVHAIDRVGETQCHRVYIASVLTQDVQVTLSWDGDSNLDLQVVDPNGNEVGRSSVQGEQTTVKDSNEGCELTGATPDGIRNEQVAWTAGSVPAGVYTVSVNYQASCGVSETNYVVRLNNAGETGTFSGTLTDTGNYYTKFVTTLMVADGTTPSELGGRTLEYAGGDEAFILNPSGEILDDATFTLRLGQAGADVYVIATNTAHHPMNPQVEQLGRAGRSAAGRLAQAAAESIAMVPQRSWVTEFNNSADLPTAGACGQQQTTPQGNTHTFLDYDESLDQVVEIRATKRREVQDGTTTLTVWVADASWVTCGECVSEEMVDAVANRFLQPDERNDVYGLVTAIFDEPWGSHDRACLIPEQSSIKLDILLYDIDGDIPDDVPDEQRTRGFFAAKDTYLRIASNPITASSNERLLLYLDAPLLAQADGPSWEITDPWPTRMISTLAHELQHMIHFFQKRVVQGSRSEVWLNEMASAVAEDLIVNNLRLLGLNGPRAVSHDDPTAGSSGISDGPLPLYNLHNDVAVTAWDGTLRSSSIGYALGAYLARAYGGAGLFRDIVQSDLEGSEAIEVAARVGHTFGDMLVNWAIANLLSDNDSLPAPNDPARDFFFYNTGEWSRSTAGNVTFRLGSINLYNYRYQPESAMQEGPFLYSLDGFNERTQPPHSNMYATLGRNTGTVRLRVDAVRDNRITVVVKE